MSNRKNKYLYKEDGKRVDVREIAAMDHWRKFNGDHWLTRIHLKGGGLIFCCYGALGLITQMMDVLENIK